ncbi:putative two-component system hydrogenase maturation factor HypX/HoxX [Catenuloplanes nepalensis]|uniref:Two-component system hydrogenase maturation factor HypX/HoxX n=1 Tax=Catenuloplanes nepalensis TaxID=587533 RepID=A0ABT9N6G7_9ACTN|nr:enoyl-CoA hydratase-related protein [Catenuloplanes nepalensis]MDP9799298.1 putative two-component system hydrogenase maturation factor HypX/HoxX [Catenuloplanes nepalensis]
MRVLLLVSAFNGLSQRVWCTLREAGHEVGVLLATGERDMIEGVRAARPDVILCPYLTHRVPAEIWSEWRTIIIHPGPVGDRGPSSLDWAITEAEPYWGVTALQAVEEMDAGPIWATRIFRLASSPPRKSALYNGPVADAAIACVQEVMTKAADPAFRPVPAERMPHEVPNARPRPLMRQSDRAFGWDEGSERIIRRIRAADGAPGVRTEVLGMPVFAYDVHPGSGTVSGAAPGTVLCRRQGAIMVATGDGSVWLGHLRQADPERATAAADPERTTVAAGPAGTWPRGVKLPAAVVLGRRLHGVPHAPLPLGSEVEVPGAYRQIRYRRTADVGWLTFDFYNGAMSAGQCRRLLGAFRHAAGQDTRVLVLGGSTEAFSNGIHLNQITAATDPAAAAWANIRAINAVCTEIIECTRQVVIAAYPGNAGAGGVMLGLGADVVAGREEIVLNPYYDIGLYGSELHTYTLPRRVGAICAERLLGEKLPVNAAHARTIGLLDEVGPRHPDAFADWLAELAARYAEPQLNRRTRSRKARALTSGLPLAVHEVRELAEMSHDIFGDRSGFVAARHAFVHKVRPTATPARLLPNTQNEAFLPAPNGSAGNAKRPVPAPPPGTQNQGKNRQHVRPRSSAASDTPQAVRPAVPAQAG